MFPLQKWPSRFLAFCLLTLPAAQKDSEKGIVRDFQSPIKIQPNHSAGATSDPNRGIRGALRGD